MAPRYLVIREDRCAACGGVGSVPNPVWLAFVDAELERYGPDGFRDRSPDGSGWAAFDAWSDAWWAEHGTGSRAPHELECGECEGAGRRRREIELGQALAELAELRGELEASELRATIGD